MEMKGRDEARALPVFLTSCRLGEALLKGGSASSGNNASIRRLLQRFDNRIS